MLVLFGIGGFSYHCFRDDGWIEAVLGNVWDATVQYPLIAIPVIVGAVFLGKMWNQSRLTHGRTSKLPDSSSTCSWRPASFHRALVTARHAVDAARRGARQAAVDPTLHDVVRGSVLSTAATA